MFVVDVGALLVVALGLQDLLVRWGVPVVGATIAAAVAVANPALLSTIRIAGYEVLVAALVVALVWTIDRHLAAPSGRRLAAVVGIGLALVLTPRPVPPAVAGARARRRPPGPAPDAPPARARRRRCPSC